MGIKNAQRLFHHRKTFGRWQIKNLRKKRRKIIYICAHLKMKNVLKFQLSFCLRCQWQKKEKTRRHAGVFLFRYRWLINEIEGSQLFCGRTRTKRVHVKKKMRTRTRWTCSPLSPSICIVCRTSFCAIHFELDRLVFFIFIFRWQFSFSLFRGFRRIITRTKIVIKTNGFLRIVVTSASALITDKKRK